MNIKSNWIQYVGAFLLIVMVSATAYSQSSYEVVTLGDVVYVISEEANIKAPLPGYITESTPIDDARESFIGHYNGFFGLETAEDRQNWVTTYPLTAQSLFRDNQVFMMMYGEGFGKASITAGLAY